MDKTTKTVLIVIGSILVLCACASLAVFATGLWTFSRVANIAEQSVSVTAEKAVRVGGEIADYDVPEGFGSHVSIHIGDMTLIRYTTLDEMSYILLAQFPQGTSIDVEKMLELMEEGTSDPNNVWYSTDTEIIEQKPVTIRGQATTLNISDGTSVQELSYRYGTAKFEGRGGPAMVIVATPVEEWDMGVVDEFISSIQ